MVQGRATRRGRASPGLSYRVACQCSRLLSNGGCFGGDNSNNSDKVKGPAGRQEKQELAHAKKTATTTSSGRFKLGLKPFFLAGALSSFRAGDTHPRMHSPT